MIILEKQRRNLVFVIKYLNRCRVEQDRIFLCFAGGRAEVSIIGIHIFIPRRRSYDPLLDSKVKDDLS